MSGEGKIKRKEELENYENLKIGTILSHSSAQIFLGAHAERLETVGIGRKEEIAVHQASPATMPTKFIEVEDYAEILSDGMQERLIEENVILIPHGSFVEYVGAENIIANLKVPMFGNKAVLEWESDRSKEQEWLSKAGLRLPKQYSLDSLDEESVEALFVKLHGAKGGKGFFAVRSKEELYREIKHRWPDEPEEKIEGDITIQQYVFGNRCYFHYFYSPLEEVEGAKTPFTKGWNSDIEMGEMDDGNLYLLGADRRDETNIDGIRRDMSVEQAESQGIPVEYVVCANIPLTIRQSMLYGLYKDGEAVINTSKKLLPPGLIGPFCLETVVTPDLKRFTFEISGRIVAGTNVYPYGSLDSARIFGAEEKMSTGKLIARQIKYAAETDQLHKIVS